MKFLNELQVMELKTEEKLNQAVDFYKKNDIWVFPYANEIRSFGVTDYPLLNKELMDKIQESCPEESFDYCVKDAGIFLSLPYKDRYMTFATRYTSLYGIYDRSGTNCRMVRTTDSHGPIVALSAEERGEIINKGWQTSKEKVKILISDEMVSFVGSPKYVILPYDDGIRAVKEELSKCFSMEYYKGYISHEYLIADWYISSDETESYRFMLEGLKICNPTDSVKFIFRFSSSNVGNSKMSGRILVSINGNIFPVGMPKSVWHLSTRGVDSTEKLDDDNGCSIEHFKYKLQFMAAAMKENEDIIEELGNTVINHERECLKNAFQLCPSISQKIKEEKISAFDPPSETNAMDIYLEVASVLEEIENKKQLIQVSEEIAQLQYKDWRKLDVVQL